MERSSELQLRLQRLVEGLSVGALGYYSLGLLAYVLKGLEGWLGKQTEAVILAVAAPVIVDSTFITMKWLKARFMHQR